MIYFKKFHAQRPTKTITNPAKNMIDDTHPLLSQPRFQPPANWDWNYKQLSGLKIRYGLPRSRKIYDAVMFIIGGLGDCAELYFEFCNDLESRNIKPIVIDLPGQGGSERYLKNPHKRHSAGFNKLLKDIHVIADEVVLSAAIDIEDNHKRLPIILFGHSMGGHLVLRYLAEYNKNSRGLPIFSAAIVTAPMVKIKAFESVPGLLSSLVSKILALSPTSYVPKGRNWSEDYRQQLHIKEKFSSDPTRGQLQKAFFSHPKFQHLAVGSPTTKWLSDAVASCSILEKTGYLEKIDIPVLIAMGGQDQLVSNAAIRKAISAIPKAELLEIESSNHEILMETDDIRTQFLDRFFTFLGNNVFNRPDKGKTFIQ